MRILSTFTSRTLSKDAIVLKRGTREKAAEILILREFDSWLFQHGPSYLPIKTIITVFVSVENLNNITDEVEGY